MLNINDGWQDQVTNTYWLIDWQVEGLIDWYKKWFRLTVNKLFSIREAHDICEDDWTGHLWYDEFNSKGEWK